MEHEVHVGSGNIFADLGLPNPEECLAKARIVVRIKDIMREQGLTQESAARQMGISRPALSNLLRGGTGGFTLDRLFRCLKAFGDDIEVRIRPKPADQDSGHLILVAEPARDEQEPELADAHAHAVAVGG